MKKFFLFAAAAFATLNFAVAQVWNPRTGPLPDEAWLPKTQAVEIFDSSISNETATVSTRVPIDVPVNSLAVFEVSVVAADAGTSNVVFSFNTSLDAVNWTTDEPYSVTIALSGTNTVRRAQALGTNLLAKYLSFDQVSTTQTNAVTISAAKLSFLPKP